MPITKDKERLIRRAAKFKDEINELGRKGYTLSHCVKEVADKYFLSESTVYHDYLSNKKIPKTPHHASTPPSR